MKPRRFLPCYWVLCAIFFSQCEQQPPIYELNFVELVEDVCDPENFWIYCLEPGNNCRRSNPKRIEYYTGPDGDVLNQFYHYYRVGNLPYFFNHYDWETAFPDFEGHNIATNIINGTYKVEVLKDSSIVILQNPAQGVTLQNIIFAIDFDSTHRMSCQ